VSAEQFLASIIVAAISRSWVDVQAYWRFARGSPRGQWRTFMQLCEELARLAHDG
jgi:hypothetical protein